jgi:hypothetical protein
MNIHYSIRFRGIKLFLITVSFHVQFSESISSETVFNGVLPMCTDGVIDLTPGIHLSVHIDTDAPSPMRFIKPKDNASGPATIARQVADALQGTHACIKLESGKYFVFNTLPHRLRVSHKPPSMLTE